MYLFSWAIGIIPQGLKNIEGKGAIGVRVIEVLLYDESGVGLCYPHMR